MLAWLTPHASNSIVYHGWYFYRGSVRLSVAIQTSNCFDCSNFFMAEMLSTWLCINSNPYFSGVCLNVKMLSFSWQSTTWTLPQSHFPKMTTQRRRQERRQEGKRQRFSQSSWVTALCVCVLQKSTLPDPFVGGSTGGDVKQSKKAYFLLHYVPTKLPISLPPSRHNSFIDWETQLVSSNFSDEV